MRTLEREEPVDAGPDELTGAVGGLVGTGVELDVEEHAVSLAAARTLPG